MGDRTGSKGFKSSLSRREFLLGAASAAVAANSLAPRPAWAGTAGGREFTEWGWPLPYEKVSETSIKWLKDTGRWPLVQGWQVTWINPCTVDLVIRKQGLLEKRGLEGSPTLLPVLSGRALNEGMIAGKIHIAEGGNFPSTGMMDAGFPVKGLLIRTPNIDHSVIVRPDSPIKEAKDLKGKVVGLATGSSAEFFFVVYARLNGLDPAKDLTLKHLNIPDQLVFPRGIDAVVPWAPNTEIMVSGLKNGKRIAISPPYQYYWGSLYIPVEIIEKAPDVVQAVVEAFIEAELWIRLHLDEASDWTVAEIEGFRKQSRELIKNEVYLYTNVYKPTQLYPFVRPYAVEGERVARWLHEGRRTKKAFAYDDYVNYFDTRFIDKAFQKLGWRIPDTPPLFPPGYTVDDFVKDVREGRQLRATWPGELKAPQPWPEPADLSRPYYFNGKVYQPKA